MKYVLLFILIIIELLFSQSGNTSSELSEEQVILLKEKISLLEKQGDKLSDNIRQLQIDQRKTQRQIDSLTEITSKNTLALEKTASILGTQISETKLDANKQFQEVNETVSTNTLYGIIFVLSIVIMSGIMYVILTRKQKSDKSDIIDQLSKTKISIEEGLVNEFSRQTQLLETKIKVIMDEGSKTQPENQVEPDHTMALRVASEINLIERNVKLMDPGTKGLKQLLRSISKLKDNLAANDYEMPELLGKQFHPGMKIIVVTSLPDENLEHGSEIISKILIPQVNYKDKMIQTAQVEVAVGV